jgi:pantothenate kinase
MIGLVGYPGSGKSYAANKLYQPAIASACGPDCLQVLGMDGFHFTRAQLAAMPNPDEARTRRGAPWTFDAEGLIARLKQVRCADTTVGWPGFDHGAGDPVENQIQVLPTTRVILVEGLYLLYREGPWAELDGVFDECWFLDVNQETALNRACQRHQDAWQMSEADARKRIDHNDRLNCAFIDPSRADWRVPYVDQSETGAGLAGR